MAARNPLDVWSSVPKLREPLAAVVGTLEEDIIFGRLTPGERLVEDALMDRFAIKRHVARQALAVLEQVGIVIREPNKGARVRAFSPREIEQIYDVRFLLNERAARLVPLPAPPSLTDRLRALQAEQRMAMGRGDLTLVHRLDNQFHDVLLEACGNPYLIDTIRRYAGIAHAIRFHRLSDPVSLANSCDEHEAMIAALEAGERERLVTLCVDHIKPSVATYLARAGGTPGD